LLAMARCAASSHQAPALALRMVSSSTEDRLIRADLQGSECGTGQKGLRCISMKGISRLHEGCSSKLNCGFMVRCCT
jgi:hypothetical protein